jgi:hypothetical protein
MALKHRITSLTVAALCAAASSAVFAQEKGMRALVTDVSKNVGAKRRLPMDRMVFRSRPKLMMAVTTFIGGGACHRDPESARRPELWRLAALHLA